MKILRKIQKAFNQLLSIVQRDRYFVGWDIGFSDGDYSVVFRREKDGSIRIVRESYHPPLEIK